MDKKTDELTDDRDSELEGMLDQLRGPEPTDLEIKRWQSAAVGLAALERSRTKIWSMLAAAAVGAVIGSVAVDRFMQNQVLQEARCTSPMLAELNNANATFETTYVKLD